MISINSHVYKKIKKLGKGGYGKVYQVLDEKENKNYAIKRIPIVDLNEEEKDFVKNEAKILSSINDEHIVKYYDSCEDDKYFNILMEYCEGSELKKFILDYKDKNEFIKEEIIYNIALDLCLGIKVIHENSLIHRDLKPENIFIDNNCKIKIGDFGVSKKLGTNQKFAITSVGTDFYMAPEILKGEEYNNEVDIWSYGCIIYELITLKVCFESKSRFGFMDNITKKSHGKIDLKKYNSKWQDLIDLLLKKNYRERPNISQVYSLLIDYKNIFRKEKEKDNSFNEDKNSSKENYESVSGKSTSQEFELSKKIRSKKFIVF